MKIKLISGATSFEAAKNTIQAIDPSDFEHKNIVVVPDAFSMQAENLVFDVLGISTTFNIEVVGISRLAGKLLRADGVDFKRISALEEVFCIYKAVKKCEEQFEYFSSCGVDLCQKILQVIKQFKSCKILPQKLQAVGDENLDRKIHDLRLIYACYEEFLGEKLDLSRLLDFFLENAKNLNNLEKINLFFVNFDSFTSQINSFIVGLSDFVANIFIGVAAPISVANAHIYENDIKAKTFALAKEKGVLVDCEMIPTSLRGEHLAIAKKLFAVNFLSENANKTEETESLDVAGEGEVAAAEVVGATESAGKIKEIEKREEVDGIDEKNQNGESRKYDKNGINNKNDEDEQNNLNDQNDDSDDFFLNIVAKNPEDEVEFVAKYIKNAVFHGAKFSDFAIAISDKKYYNLIKTTFADYQILLNCDDATDLSQTILGRFVLKMLEISRVGFSQQSFEYLLSSPLLGVNFEGLSKVFYHQIEKSDDFLKFFPEYEKIVNLIKMLKNCHKICDFCSILLRFLDLVQENYQKFLAVLEDEKFFKKQSENLQAVQLVQKTIERLEEIGGEENVTIFDFENLLAFAFSSVKVETIPSYIDATFCGDATDSYFEDVKTLFVLGADDLPRAQSDVGLIDDEEIKKLRLNFALEPEIRVLNRRNRLKLFELLQHAQQKLVVCTPFSHDGRQAQKAEFVKDLEKIFGQNIVHTTAFEDFDLPMFSREENFERLMFYVGCRKNFPSAYSNLKSKNKLPRAFASSLNVALGTTLPKNENLSPPTSEILCGDVISASKLETYFSCPFKHMVRYGLGIKEKESSAPNAKDFGSFEHMLLKEFVQNFDLSSCKATDVQNFLNDHLLQIASNFYEENELKKGYFLNYLKNESRIILENLIAEQKRSEFRPQLLEQKVNMKIAGKTLVGFVDRVDFCGEFFRIIDYKTGETGNVLKELFYGKKLQLFLYAKAISESCGKTLAGVYYFDCKTKFKKRGKGKPFLSGVTKKDEKIVALSDKKIAENQKSQVLGVELRKNVKKNEFSYKYGNFVDDFSKYLDYAVTVSEQAVSEILDGFAEAKPVKGNCEFCPYNSICKHVDLDGHRAFSKVDKKSDS